MNSSAGLVPVSIDYLVNTRHDLKLVIDGKKLRKHNKLLKELSYVDLTPVDISAPYMDISVYYLFESKYNGKILDVAMWGITESAFVDGIEYIANDIFYDMIIPFLPKNAAEKVKKKKNVRNLVDYDRIRQRLDSMDYSM